MTSKLPRPPAPQAGVSKLKNLASGASSASNADPKTLQAAQKEASSRLDSRLGTVRSQFAFSLYRYIPYPVLMLMPFIKKDMKALVRNWQQRKSAQVDTEPEDAIPPTVTEPRQTALFERLSPYLRYRCPEQPLTCSRLQPTPAGNTPSGPCAQCGFPGLLQPKAEIRGQRGRYRIETFLGSRGWGRLYGGQDVNRRQPVMIKEYLLPNQHFTGAEQQRIRDTFETVAGLKLADGREQDFRMMEPWDAVGDRQEPERCYLITTGPVDTYPTLRSMLVEQGALTPLQVRQVLNQLLQTLESLHGQKYMLPAGQIQEGLTHGNLTLDSIVMLADAASYYERSQLLVFLRDLSLWEFLFIPPPVPVRNLQPTDDLKAVGQIGLYLLGGRWADDYGRRLQPRNPAVWPERDLPLEQFLRQLLTLEKPNFEDAAAARRALLARPLPPTETPVPLVAPEVEPPKPKRSFPLWLLFLLLGSVGLIVALLVGWWWSRRQPVAQPPTPLCCLAEVSAIPPGQFTYAATRQGSWYPLWHSKNLVMQGQTLEQVLETEQPELDLQLVPVATPGQAIAQVLQDQVEFAIAPLPQDRPLDLTADPIAYDGLVAFVAFSYVERNRGLPQHLNGQLSLDQLRQLYTGEIRNWQQLGGPDLPVKLYVPTQPELIHVFEQRVLQTSAAIQQFRRIWGLEAVDSAPQNSGFIRRPDRDLINGERLSTLEMLQQILQDFEAQPQLGSIGFASLSQVSGQCSVYPLAIAANQAAVQPIYQRDDTPISPAVDLCGDKGNYGPKQELFAEQTYPLAYPLTVLYRPDNSRLPIGPTFVQLMTTDEGQALLAKTGLVPLRAEPLP